MLIYQTDDLSAVFSDDVPMTYRRRPMTYPMTSLPLKGYPGRPFGARLPQGYAPC